MRTRLSRTVKRTLLTTAVAAAAFGGTAVPSAAADDSSDIGTLAKGDCPSNRLCLWDNTNFGNTNGWVSIPVQDGLRSLPEEWRNRAGSVFNNTGRDVRLYNVGCPDVYLSVPAGFSSDELNDHANPCGGTWNNKVDALQFV